MVQNLFLEACILLLRGPPFALHIFHCHLINITQSASAMHRQQFLSSIFIRILGILSHLAHLPVPHPGFLFWYIFPRTLWRSQSTHALKVLKTVTRSSGQTLIRPPHRGQHTEPYIPHACSYGRISCLVLLNIGLPQAPSAMLGNLIDSFSPQRETPRITPERGLPKINTPGRPVCALDIMPPVLPEGNDHSLTSGISSAHMCYAQRRLGRLCGWRLLAGFTFTML